ncbi:MAG: hypothetical protein ACRYF9_06610 [Janthinobacterium lividum]
MQPPSDDDGVTHFQRLNPQQFDVVLGSHPGRRPAARPSGVKLGWIAALAMLCACAWLLAARLQGHAPSPQPANAVQEPMATVTDEPADALPVQPVTAAVLAPVVTAPRAQADATPAKPQPLDDCLKNGTAINDEVAKCRFGAVPKPDPAPTSAQGMVSARYMAQYKADQVRPVTRQGKPYQVATVEIREWKGRNRYRAQWKIVDNEIDNASVCTNFPSDTVEHRECRRAAVVYFKEACQEWTKRADHENDDQTLAARQRYCLATKTFAAAD